MSITTTADKIVVLPPSDDNATVQASTKDKHYSVPTIQLHSLEQFGAQHYGKKVVMVYLVYTWSTPPRNSYNTCSNST